MLAVHFPSAGKLVAAFQKDELASGSVEDVKLELALKIHKRA